MGLMPKTQAFEKLKGKGKGKGTPSDFNSGKEWTVVAQSVPPSALVVFDMKNPYQ